MNLKSLAYRELSEGMTEKELASLIQVPVRTLSKILADKDPQDPAIWEKFARYFRMDVEVLRTGDPAHLGTVHGLQGSSHYSAAGHIRKIPLLNWYQLSRLVAGTGPVPITAGSTPQTAVARIRAIGLRPSSSAVIRPISRSAAAPSLSGELLPAVTVPNPGGMNAGFNAASPSRLQSGRTH